MKAPKKSTPSKTELPLFPTLFKAKATGTSGKPVKPDLNLNPSSGLRGNSGFRPASLIRKGRAGT